MRSQRGVCEYIWRRSEYLVEIAACQAQSGTIIGEVDTLLEEAGADRRRAGRSEMCGRREDAEDVKWHKKEGCIGRARGSRLRRLEPGWEGAKTRKDFDVQCVVGQAGNKPQDCTGQPRLADETIRACVWSVTGVGARARQGVRQRGQARKCMQPRRKSKEENPNIPQGVRDC